MPMPSGMPGHGDMPTTSGMPSMSGTPGMSGMMSEQDMAALQNAQGVEASKLILTQMIAHHEGAITMAQTEIKEGQYPAAVKLARAIVTAQQTEIETMKGPEHRRGDARLFVPATVWPDRRSDLRSAGDRRHVRPSLREIYC